MIMMAAEMTKVEEEIRRAVYSDVSLLTQASEHVLGSGGKRLRPRVALLSYMAAGGEDVSKAIPLAAAVELLHTASLIHDDINDCSELRRGQASASAVWGDGLALLIGDFVFIKCLGLMPNFSPRVLQRMADCCTAIVEGETLQVLHQGDASMTESLYLEIVSKKTASLFSASAELGAVEASGSDQTVAAFRDFGLNLGVAFQIRDDTLDTVGNKGQMGKPVAVDLKQGKMNLATLFALRESEQAKEVLSCGDMQQVCRLLRETGAVEYAIHRAQEYGERAKATLSALPGSDAKTALIELADFALTRDA